MGQGMSDDDPPLTELSDPEFIARWAELRQRVAWGHVEDRARYQDAAAEYRRRLDGR